MHVSPPARRRAFRILSDCLRPGGALVLTLRHGADEAENRERGFHRVAGDELLALARVRALVLKIHAREVDRTRADIQWETLVFTLPDDGAGSLPRGP